MTVQQDTLPNGFRIVTEHMPGLQSAAIGIWVSAGGRHERLEQNGIAHFLEHMAFKGTKTRTALQIAEAIEDVGGYINAYTSREVTAYYARVLKDDVGLALDVIGDIVRNSIFDEREIEVERGVILQEIGQALDTPDDIIFDWLQEESYREQAIGRSILGPAERVRSFSKEDLRRFVSEHYGPGQMILAAAGAVDHAEIVKAAEVLFGDMEPKTQDTLVAAKFTGGEFVATRPWNRLMWRSPLKVRATAPMISMRRKSTRARLGAACPRVCSKRCARNAACATRFSRKLAPMRTPA